jgi:hypothetical protein
MYGKGNTELPSLFKLTQMKRTATLLGFAFMCVLFSCKKDVVTTPTADLKSISEKNLSLVTVNGTTTNTDTIPPTYAVDVRNYGAKGDGVTDDTRAIQNAINAQSVLVFNKGTYIINQTIIARSGVKIYGKNGATIKGGGAISGTLSSAGRYFDIENCNNNQITNLVFVPSIKAFSLGAWANSLIFIKNSTYTNVSYNRFNFNLPYAAGGVDAIWVDGAGANHTFIYKNTCNTVGIIYAEAGASNTLCQSNTVNNSHSNAIIAHGNGTVFGTGNQVVNNTINNAGFNAIDDFGLMDGTVIRGNVINGSGKSPTEGWDGEGIQAVGVNTVITGNYIADAQAEYIELSSTNKTVQNNTLVDKGNTAAGIVVNTNMNTQTNARSSATVIDHNTIYGCHDGVEIYGTYPTSVQVTNNTFYNPLSTAVEVINKSTTWNVTLSGNIFNMNKPNLQARNAVLTYTSTPSTTELVNLSNNTFNYATTAAGGAGGETAISAHTNGMTLVGNKVNGNGIKSSAGKEVTAMNDGGYKYTGYTFTNNTFSGCLWYISGYAAVSKSGNNF